MKNFYVLAVLFFLSVLITSCSKDSVDSGMNPNGLAQTRTAQNVNLEISISGGSKVSMAVESASIDSVSGGTFLVTVKSGSSTQTYTATSLSATHDDSGLRVVKNAGPNQTIYENKSTVSITVSNGELAVAINPNSIMTVSQSIVIDEMDGI